MEQIEPKQRVWPQLLLFAAQGFGFSILADLIVNGLLFHRLVLTLDDSRLFIGFGIVIEIHSLWFRKGCVRRRFKTVALVLFVLAYTFSIVSDFNAVRVPDDHLMRG